MSHADHGSTDTSSTTATSAHSMMVPYLHFTGGDYLFFDTWQPRSGGALVGACIGLIVLALFERWLAATRVVFAAHWRHRASVLTAARDQSVMARTIANMDGSTDKHHLVKPELYEMSRRGTSNSPSPASRPSPGAPKSTIMTSRVRTVAPFIAAHDIPRGLLFALQMLIMYILMLAVMTFQAAYIIAIVLGLGVGEVIFGRVAAAESH